MKTAIEIAEKEIAELWSSPSDQPTYTQIFEVLERVKPIFEQQIIDAYNSSSWETDKDIEGHHYYDEKFKGKNPLM